MEYTLDLGPSGRVGVAEYGMPDGLPVLWCHGGPGSRLDARPAHRGALEAGVRILALDRPGIGHSDLTPVATVASWAPIAAAALDRLDIDRFAVAGWSAGGAYALACGARLSGRVLAISTLAAPYPEGEAPIRSVGSLVDRILMPISASKPHRVEVLLLGFHGVPNAVVRWGQLASAGTRDRRAIGRASPREASRFLREAWRGGARGVAEDYRRMVTPWGFELAEVEQSVALWHGVEDSIVPLSDAVALAAALPKATVHEVVSSGHFLQFVAAREILVELVERARAAAES